LYAPIASGSNPSDPAVAQALVSFFSSLWGGTSTTPIPGAYETAVPTAAEKLGFQYFYDEAGSLLFEQGTGGANSTGRSFYVHLPTPSGPMPIAVYLDAKHYAVHTDHLNTPRRLTSSSQQPVWQWAFSAFGDEVPTKASNRFADPATTPNAGTTTVADVTFNLRYPGQYFDKESGLNYNYFRSYDAKTGRYTQADPIDLAGGWNKFGYVDGNPLGFTDPDGLNKRFGAPPQPMFPRIGPTRNEVAGPYSTTTQSNSVNGINSSRGRMGNYSGNLLDFFARNVNGPINSTTTQNGALRFETTLPNGTRLQYREGPNGPRVDIFPPGGTPETMHAPSPIGGACLP
jgi:RHS repeat-associated protein